MNFYKKQQSASPIKKTEKKLGGEMRKNKPLDDAAEARDQK